MAFSADAPMVACALLALLIPRADPLHKVSIIPRGAQALGYTMPHFIQVPGGPASLYGLAAVSGFLTKAMGAFVDKAVDLLGVKELILIAHEDCGAYKAGRVEVLAQLTRRLSGKNMKNVQIEHLQKGARDLQARAGHGIEVLAFYGSILDNGSFKQIRYEPVDFASRVRA